jgi:hypothetical protein
MLQVIEQTPDHLILRDQRPSAGIVAVIFTVLSFSATALLAAQFIAIYTDRITRFDGLLWLVGMSVFLALCTGFTVLGVLASRHFLIGPACLIDRDSESIVIERIGLMRRHQETYSLYGVSHIDIQHNDEVHAFGVFLVLKSHQRVPVASFHDQDEDAMRALVADIRAFLRA